MWPFSLALLMISSWPAMARADQVDRLIGQLESSSDYKVRLSAALNLAKVGDRRAIPVFIEALSDKDNTVRGVAAAALGKLVNSSTKAEQRDKVLSALRQSAARDPNSFVRKQSQKAYDALKGLAGGPGAVKVGGVFVSIGAMSAEVRNASAMIALMRQTARETFRRHAPAMLVDWPGGGNPGAREIKERRLDAFLVDGTLNTVSTAGGVVECKMSMLLATYPARSMFGFLKGGAKVEGGGSEGDAELAAQDCVVAVVEDLIARKIIPTIQARVP